MYIQPISLLRWTLAAAAPIATLAAVDAAVTLIFNKKFADADPYQKMPAYFLTVSILGGAALTAVHTKLILPNFSFGKYFPFWIAWNGLCVVGSLGYTILTPGLDQIVTHHDFPPGPACELLKLWKALSKKLHVKFKCYSNHRYPKKYSIEKQFHTWCQTHQTQLLSIQTLSLFSTSLSPHIRKLVNLEELTIFEAETLPSTLAELPQLKKLSLPFFKFTSLPTEIGSCVNLEELDLSNPPLPGPLPLPPSFTGLTQLKKLRLSYCELTSWPLGIDRCPNLKHLDLSYNQINSIPNDIHLPTTLKHLDLSHNQLPSLPPSFLRLPRNLTIDAQDNAFSPETVLHLQTQLQQIQQTTQDQGPRLYTSINDRISHLNERVSILETHDGTNTLAILPLDQNILSWLKDIQQQFPLLHQTHPAHFPSETSSAATCPAFYAPLLNHAKAAALSTFLEKLTTTQDYKQDGPAKRQVIKLVHEILQTACIYESFRTKLFDELLPEANQRCGDRATFFLNEMEAEVYLANADQKTDQELATLLVGIQRLHLLKEYAQKRVDLLGYTDALQVHLYYQCELKETLNLPISSEGMLYKNLGKVPPETLKEDAAFVLSQTQDPADIYNILIASKVWHKKMEKNHKVDFDQQDKELGDRLEQLDRDTSLKDQERIEQMNALKQERENKTRILVEDKTRLFLSSSKS